jgi:hypothetical protein
MSTTTLSRKHRTGIAASSATTHAIRSALSANTELAVNVTSTASVPVMKYANVPALGDNDYFKPQFATHVLQMLAAPLDENAPEGKQEFIDWLNAE